MSSEDLLGRHRAVMPAWLALYYDRPLEFVSGRGSRVTDSDGNTYLDFFAGILTNMLGYDRPRSAMRCWTKSAGVWCTRRRSTCCAPRLS